MHALVFMQQLELKIQAEKLQATAKNATTAEQWNPEFMSRNLWKSEYLLEEASANSLYKLRFNDFDM
jgi:hypothetical protein